jgi:hypothetical protein
MRRPAGLQDAALLRPEHFREILHKGHSRTPLRPHSRGVSYTNCAA